MFKIFFGKKVGDLFGSLRARSGTSEDPASTQFAESTPPVLTPAEILAKNGRVACRVISQVLRRSGFDAALFRFTAEYHNQASNTLRILTDIPSTVAMSQSQCTEIELTTKVELEMRFEVNVSVVYWRTRDGISESISEGGLEGGMSSTDSSALKAGKPTAFKKSSYPEPVRIAHSDELHGLVDIQAREGTPSEIEEFHGLLAQTLSPTVK